MENVSYDIYIANGGLIPRSVIARKSPTDTTQITTFYSEHESILKEIEAKFVALSRRGTNLDEIEHTHPLVSYILKEFLDYSSTQNTDGSRSDRPDFVAAIKNSPSIPVEVKAFYYRDLGKANGSKDGESAVQQISRYILKRSNNIFGSLDVGILTNGRDWRMQDARGNFVEFDLEALIRDCTSANQKRSLEAQAKLMLFRSLFGSNYKFRRALLFEGANIWQESYAAFRQRYSTLLQEISKLRLSEESINISKELSLWLIFIRSLEDLGVLPASPHHSGAEYYKYQLISFTNWRKYSDKKELLKLINLVASNKFVGTNSEKFIESLPAIDKIDRWPDVYGCFSDFLFMNDGQTPFDFGDLYSREFGMIYVNLIDDSKEHSAYFTSPSLAFAAADEVEFEADGKMKIIDPACGSGTLLRAVYEHKLRNFVQLGQEKPNIEEFFGCDIEPLSILLCKMNLWIGSANRGQPLPNLDFNIKRKNVFEVWDELSINDKDSFVDEVWPGKMNEEDRLFFIANPPWGESSSEVDAVRSKQRNKISKEQRESMEKLLGRMKVDTFADNLYIPFACIPFLEGTLKRKKFAAVSYAFILPDQFFVGTQREGLRKSVWSSVQKYLCYNNNRDGHFEGSVLGDDPDPNMRFGVVFGTISDQAGQIKIIFNANGRSKPLPRSCKKLHILPLLTSESDLNNWKAFFDSNVEKIPLSWHKGEVNRKGKNRDFIQKMKSFGGKDACKVVCSSQGEWKKLAGKFIDPKILVKELWKNEVTAQKKLKEMTSKRMVVPAQLSSGTGNTYSADRILIASNMMITDNWHWISSSAKNLTKIQSILISDEWSSISRAMATRRCLPINLLNALGLPDIEIVEQKKVS